MKIKWRYTEPVDKSLIDKIERVLAIKLPDDYKKLLEDCNSGKPTTERFDIANRKACVLDYMIDLADIIGISGEFNILGLIPIAYDPFGNLISFKYSNNGKTLEVVFWDHETNDVVHIANSFSEFLESLY